MKAIKMMITVLLIIFPVVIKSQQARNLEDYSDYINQKKNNIKMRQERARKYLHEFLGESDVSCLVHEMTCNFDVSQCGFVQDKEDKFDWTRLNGNKTSSSTRPSFDHTTRNKTGYYMYIEATSNWQQGDAKLYSPPFKFKANTCLTFYYHMYGAHSRSLKVIIIGKLSFSVTGDKGNAWHKACINISAISVRSHRITFEGILGSGSAGGIAIDDFSLTTAGSFACNLCECKGNTCSYKNNTCPPRTVDCSDKYSCFYQSDKCCCPRKSCPNGWSMFKSNTHISCYFIVDKGEKNITMAEKECEKLGATLPFIKSAKENEFLLNLMRNRNFWFGMQAPQKDNIFYWADGTPVATTYSNWSKGEPNFKGKENCAYMYTRSYAPGKWNNNLCSQTRHVLCLK